MDLKRRIFEAFRRIAIFISLPLFFCLLSSEVWYIPLQKVRLQHKWYHQFQFAGYYAANAKGFYRDEGLDVELIEGSEEGSPYKIMLERKTEFGIQDAGDLILDLPTARKPRPDREVLRGETEAMEKIVMSTVVEIG